MSALNVQLGVLAIAGVLALGAASLGLPHGGDRAKLGSMAPRAAARLAQAGPWLCPPTFLSRVAADRLTLLSNCVVPPAPRAIAPLNAQLLAAPLPFTPAPGAMAPTAWLASLTAEPAAAPEAEVARPVNWLGVEIDRYSPVPSTVLASLPERPSVSPVKAKPWIGMQPRQAVVGRAPSEGGIVRYFATAPKAPANTRLVVTSRYEAVEISPGHRLALPPELMANGWRMSFYLGELERKLREAFPGRWAANKPILSLSSGYRDEAHNAEVGGVPNSSHTKALAADIRAEGMHTVDLAEFIERNMGDIEIFDQVLAEQASESISWVHVQLSPSPRYARRQVMSVDTSCAAWKGRGAAACQHRFYPGLKKIFLASS